MLRPERGEFDAILASLERLKLSACLIGLRSLRILLEEFLQSSRRGASLRNLPRSRPLECRNPVVCLCRVHAFWLILQVRLKACLLYTSRCV